MLEEIEIDISSHALSRRAEEIINITDAEIDKLFETERNKRIPKYMPCDPRIVYAAMRHLQSQNEIGGENFCEWGSGFGMATMLAAELGFDATGIEIEPYLVAQAESLSVRLGSSAKFLETSYIPEGFDGYSAMGGDEIILPDDFEAIRNTIAYEGMDLPIDEIDLVFCYPWPGEQEFVRQLFEAVAGDESVLLVYHGDAEIYAFRNLLE